MIYLPLFVLCVVFFELFMALHMGKDAFAILARSRESMRVLASADMSDDEKEAYVRRASLDTFKATLGFALKFVVIGVVLYLVFMAIVTLMPARRDELVQALYSPLVIVVLTVLTIAYAWVRTKLRAPAAIEGRKPSE